MAQGTPKARTPTGRGLATREPQGGAPPGRTARAPAVAPGAPGRPARWAAGAKDGVGAALGTDSLVWFTLRHGILTEVFFPCADTASTRELRLLVADGHDFFSAEGRDTQSELRYLAAGFLVRHWPVT